MGVMAVFFDRGRIGVGGEMEKELEEKGWSSGVSHLSWCSSPVVESAEGGDGGRCGELEGGGVEVEVEKKDGE